MYLIIDLEATCWEAPNTPDINEIIDMGIVVCDSSYEVISSWNNLVKPKIRTKLSPFCRRLTSITQESIDKAALFESVIFDFREWFRSEYGCESTNCIWYTWGSWDLRCVLFDCERSGIEFPFGEHRDLKDIYSEVRNLSSGEKRNLKDVIIREGLGSTEGLHRAKVDAIATAKIAHRIFSEISREL